MSTSTRQKQRNYKLNEANAVTQQRQPIMLNTKEGQVELDIYVMVPAYFITHQSLLLTHIEARVMLYIFYRTLGFRDSTTGARKTWDAISHSQFLNGITTRAGRQLDMGAGVSERSLDKALDGLEEKGFIRRERIKDQHNRHHTTIYELDLKRAGSMWLKPKAVSEDLSSLTSTSTCKVNEGLGSKDCSNYKPIHNQVKVNATSSEVIKERPAPASDRPHFEVEQPKMQPQPSVYKEQNTTEEANTHGVAPHANDITARATTEGKGQHWHEDYVNQEVLGGEQEQTGSAIPVRVQGGFPQFYGEGSRNFTGRVPAILQDTTESYNKKDSNNKNKTQQLCDAPVGEANIATSQVINSSRHHSQTCVNLVDQDFSYQTANSRLPSVMSNYPVKQPITAYKPQKAFDHSTRPITAYKAPDAAGNQPLEANPELVQPEKAGEVGITGQEQLEALVEEFCQAGVSYIKAHYLAEIAYSNGHQAGSYVGECLRYIQKQQGIKSRLGLLVYLITTNWQPPTNQQKRFGSGVLTNNHALASKWAHLNNRTSLHCQEEQVSADSSPADINSECEAQSWSAGAGGQGSATHGLVAPGPFEMSPTPEQCREVWLRVCQTAVAEWGVDPELLVNSWLIPAASELRYLLLHLPEPSRLAAIRYKFSNLVRRELELDPSWQVVEEQQYSHFAVAS